jgi:polysaccharide biosynthesis/export protein
MKFTKTGLYFPLFVFIVILTMNSCVNSKKLAYFNNIPRDTTVQMQAIPKLFKINKNDLLQITIQSLDVQAMAAFNQTSASASSGGTLPSASAASASGAQSGGTNTGYLVDEKGNITLPLLGIVKAEGLTKEELAEEIKKEFIDKKIILDPIVTIRVLNYKITILGEVNHPGVIPVPNEKITFPEALGLAGDLTVYGRRDNALLVRMVGDKLVYKRFSLNNDQIFDKDVYYLQNNDLIYIEGNKAKAGLSERSTQTIPIFLSALSLLAVILTLALRK